MEFFLIHVLFSAFQQRKSYWPSLKFHKQGLQPGYTEMEGNHDREIIMETGS